LKKESNSKRIDWIQGSPWKFKEQYEFHFIDEEKGIYTDDNKGHHNLKFYDVASQCKRTIVILSS
jgi:hypothetical protein